MTGIDPTTRTKTTSTTTIEYGDGTSKTETRRSWVADVVDAPITTERKMYRTSERPFRATRIGVSHGKYGRDEWEVTLSGRQARKDGSDGANSISAEYALGIARARAGAPEWVIAVCRDLLGADYPAEVDA